MSVAVLGIVFLALGIRDYSSAAPVHTTAVQRLAAARAHLRAVTHKTEHAANARASLAQKLHAEGRRLAQLRAAQASGFAAAISTGATRGANAGARKGAKDGRSAALAERDHVSVPGWYYVHVGWQSGLPVILKSYRLQPGASHAYWTDGTIAYNRDTTSG